MGAEAYEDFEGGFWEGLGDKRRLVRWLRISLGTEEEGRVRIEDVLKEEGLDLETEAKVYEAGDDDLFVIQENLNET